MAVKTVKHCSVIKKGQEHPLIKTQLLVALYYSTVKNSYVNDIQTFLSFLC